MTLLFNVLLFAHFLGMATLIGALFVQWLGNVTKLSPAWLWGALVQAVTGLAMLGMRDAGAVDTPLDTSEHIKLGVKLLVLVIIVIHALIGYNKPEKARSMAFIMGGLTVVNVGIAVFWS